MHLPIPRKTQRNFTYEDVCLAGISDSTFGVQKNTRNAHLGTKRIMLIRVMAGPFMGYSPLLQVCKVFNTGDDYKVKIHLKLGLKNKIELA